MSTQNHSLSKHRIAVIIDDDTKSNRYLVQLLQRKNVAEVFVAADPDTNKTAGKIVFASVRKIAAIPKNTVGRLFRGIVLKHPPLISVKSQAIPCNFVGSFDSKSFQDAVSAFQPNAILVTGANTVTADLPDISVPTFRIHLGFKPYYGGPDALAKTVAQKNYQYLGITVSKTDTTGQDESILKYVPVIPYPLEPYVLFKNRISLQAQEVLIETVLDAVESSQGTNHGNSNPQAEQPLTEPAASGSTESANAPILDMSRFSVTNGGVDYSGNRVVKKFVRKRLRRRSIANGWYILNYHDICANSEFENSSVHVPSIYTEQTRFLQHLEYWQEEFKAVSIYEGIELLSQNKLQQDRYLTITFDDGLSSSATAINSVNSAGFRPTLFLCGDPTVNNRPLANHANLLATRISKETNRPVEEIREDILKMSAGKSIDTKLAESIMAEYITQQDLGSNLVEGKFDIGAHSMTHTRPMGSIDPEQASQVTESLAAISRATNKNIDLYAHPFGKISDRSVDTDWAAEQHSTFHFACSGGVNVLSNPLGAINRIAIHNESVDEINDLMLMQWGA